MLRTVHLLGEAVHPSDDLVKRVAALEAENVALRSALVVEDVGLPATWKLTVTESLIFRVLLRHDLVTKKALVVAMHGREGTPSELKGLDVFLSRIRSKTSSAKVKIETVLGVGYRLADREAWNKALSLKDTERN